VRSGTTRKKQFTVRAKQTEIMRFCGPRNPLVVVRNLSGSTRHHPRVHRARSAVFRRTRISRAIDQRFFRIPGDGLIKRRPTRSNMSRTIIGRSRVLCPRHFRIRFERAARTRPTNGREGRINVTAVFDRGGLGSSLERKTESRKNGRIWLPYDITGLSDGCAEPGRTKADERIKKKKRTACRARDSHCRPNYDSQRHPLYAKRKVINDLYRINPPYDDRNNNNINIDNIIILYARCNLSVGRDDVCTSVVT